MTETDKEKCFRHLKRSSYKEAQRARAEYDMYYSPYRNSGRLSKEQIDNNTIISDLFLNAYLLFKVNWTAEEFWTAVEVNNGRSRYDPSC